MEEATRRRISDHLGRLTWWALFVIVVIYGAFALAMGISEILFVAGVAPEINVAYPLALFRSCTVNLAAAEFWIRRTSRATVAPPTRGRACVADAFAR